MRGCSRRLRPGGGLARGVNATLPLLRRALQLFNVWVEPEVVVSVRVADGSPGVIFEAGECT